MDFNFAMVNINMRSKLARTGWNGKGMFIFRVNPSDYKYTAGFGMEHPPLPFIAMKTADGFVVPWIASQSDMLADDWEILF